MIPGTTPLASVPLASLGSSVVDPNPDQTVGYPTNPIRIVARLVDARTLLGAPVVRVVYFPGS